MSFLITFFFTSFIVLIFFLMSLACHQFGHDEIWNLNFVVVVFSRPSWRNKKQIFKVQHSIFVMNNLMTCQIHKSGCSHFRIDLCHFLTNLGIFSWQKIDFWWKMALLSFSHWSFRSHLWLCSLISILQYISCCRYLNRYSIWYSKVFFNVGQKRPSTFLYF